jgi:hypothetical protein
MGFAFLKINANVMQDMQEQNVKESSNVLKKIVQIFQRAAETEIALAKIHANATNITRAKTVKNIIHIRVMGIYTCDNNSDIFSVDPSSYSVCSGNGQCIDDNVCVCFSGFEGSNCESSTTSQSSSSLIITSVTQLNEKFEAPNYNAVPNFYTAPVVSFNNTFGYNMFMTSSFPAGINLRNAILSRTEFYFWKSRAFLQFSTNRTVTASNVVEIWLYKDTNFNAYASASIDALGARYLKLYYNLGGTTPLAWIRTPCNFVNNERYTISLEPILNGNSLQLHAEISHVNGSLFCNVSTQVTSKNVDLEYLQIMIGQSNYFVEQGVAVTRIVDQAAGTINISTSIGMFGVQCPYGQECNEAPIFREPDLTYIYVIVLLIVVILLLCIGLIASAVITWVIRRKEHQDQFIAQRNDQFSPMTSTELDEISQVDTPTEVE